MKAAGAYLRVRRELEGMSRVDVASIAGTNEAQMVRIENGKIDTRGSLLFAIIKAVHGDARKVAKLILDKDATVADGEKEAQERVDQISDQLASEFPDSTDAERLEAILQTAMKLMDRDPSLIDRWIGYADGLAEDPGGPSRRSP